MNRLIAMACLATALALPVLVTPATAQASCADRKAAGTVVGGVGGALIGNSISRGGGGAILGGLGGAVLGHEVAAGSCHRERRAAYYRDRRYRPGYGGPAYGGPAGYGDPGYGPGYGGEGPPPPPERVVYYDPYGNPINQDPALTDPRYAAQACRTQMQDYYDNRGALVQRPIQVCDR
jgi:hypothetical protein